MTDRRTNAPGQLSRDRLLRRSFAKAALSTVDLAKVRLSLLATVVLLAALSVPAQQVPISGSANDFNSVEYFKAPHQQDIKLLFSGAEALPLEGGLLLVKKVKIEEFDVDGKLRYVAETPECVYDPVNVVANSPGEIHMRNGDGQLEIDGEGFSWRQNDSVLTISNQVNTVIDRKPASKR